jgi:predicted O-methyltransferase YrrM
MEIINRQIEDYLKQLTPPSHPVLIEMEKYAAEHSFPIVGPLVGRFLQQLVILTGARRIFELGSGYGYSALWMALAAPDAVEIHCCEFKAENIDRGREWLKRAGVGGRVEWHQGDARDAIRGVDGEFDIVINDIDKQWYPEALDLAWPKLRSGGVMVTDNALWDGRVVSENPPSESTSGVLSINEKAYKLPYAMATLIPLRDGLLVITKK